MFLIIPRKVSVPFERWPVANFAIIGLIILAFFALRGTISGYEVLFWELAPPKWTLEDFFLHMWIHAGWIHLIGNLVSLWVFGNAVCAKVGNVAYPFMYVGLGLAAIVSHILISGEPAVGASGAISGIVGMLSLLHES